jgi:hypothetical protein
MRERAAALSGLAKWMCGMLLCFVLMTVATEVMAWHKYQVLLALPLQESDASDNARVVADMWLGNMTGWWQATGVATALLFIFWLWSMRSLADVVWPQGQRRHTAWALFGWLLPVVQLFMPKMFINDLWAAAQPASRRRRGNALLTVWWLSVLAVGHWVKGDVSSPLENAGNAGEASQALRHLMLSDALCVAVAVLTIAVVRRLSGMLTRAVNGRRWGHDDPRTAAEYGDQGDR